MRRKISPKTLLVLFVALVVPGGLTGLVVLNMLKRFRSGWKRAPKRAA